MQEHKNKQAERERRRRIGGGRLAIVLGKWALSTKVRPVRSDTRHATSSTPLHSARRRQPPIHPSIHPQPGPRPTTPTRDSPFLDPGGPLLPLPPPPSPRPPPKPLKSRLVRLFCRLAREHLLVDEQGRQADDDDADDAEDDDHAGLSLRPVLALDEVGDRLGEECLVNGGHFGGCLLLFLGLEPRKEKKVNQLAMRDKDDGGPRWRSGIRK